MTIHNRLSILGTRYMRRPLRYWRDIGLKKRKNRFCRTEVADALGVHLNSEPKPSSSPSSFGDSPKS
jgi:hypothetical protein